MTADLVIRGARINDGTGLPGFTGDVEVRDGRITRVGRLRGAQGAKVIEADGLDLTPGFVDVHTHYDAQLLFEPSASPSSWHGVTTVLTGNCGFTLAPAKPEDLDWLVLMLAKVEGMSAAALRAGVPFRGGSLGDYLRQFDGRIGVNMASYVGHAAVRRWVMGAAASERTATPDEIRAMQALVDQAMRDGALGLSTSQLDVHADHEGKPVPPNLASPWRSSRCRRCSPRTTKGRSSICAAPSHWVMTRATVACWPTWPARRAARPCTRTCCCVSPMIPTSGEPVSTCSKAMHAKACACTRWHPRTRKGCTSL